MSENIVFLLGNILTTGMKQFQRNPKPAKCKIHFSHKKNQIAFILTNDAFTCLQCNTEDKSK